MFLTSAKGPAILKAMQIIQSTQNPLVKLITSLQTNKGRQVEGLFVAEGTRTIQTILESSLQPKYLFCLEGKISQAHGLKIAHLATIVSEQVMAKISTSTTPPGILAVFPIPKPGLPITINNGTVLAQIADPGNLGTLIRTAIAFGHTNIFLIEGCDPWGPKVIQATSGTITQAKIYPLAWEELVQLKGSKPLCGLVVSGGQKPKDLNLQESLLVIGNEAHGLPQGWINQCEQHLTIPMPGKTESLNAAIAGAIALYLTSNAN